MITGISGFLGAKLGALISELGDYSAIGLYNTYERNSLTNLNLDLEKVDLRDARKLSDVISHFEPEIIFHCAALRELEFCESHPTEAWEVNVQGTRNIVECCCSLGTKMVFMSSDIVFDGSLEKYTENSMPKPLNVYGNTKLQGEQIVLDRMKGSCSLIIRLSVLYGNHPLARREDFVNYIYRSLKENRKITLFTNKYRNVTFADWAMKTILKLCNKGAYGIFHVCGDECVSNYEWGLMVATEFRLRKENITTGKMSVELGGVIRPERLFLDNSKLKMKLGHDAAMPPITETLKYLHKS